MTYEELLSEFEKHCYFADEARDWWGFRTNEIRSLSFAEYRDLKERALLLIECDSNCC